MSFTAEQKAYHLHKMRTRIFRININKDGFISHELMGIKLAEHSGMTGEKAEAAKKQFLKVADMINLKPGVNIIAPEIGEDLITHFSIRIK